MKEEKNKGRPFNLVCLGRNDENNRRKVISLQT
jgi:hypothetical protein